MIAVDTNVLVYAHREELHQHASARSVLREMAEGATPWALPVFVLGEFLRVVTHPRMRPPSTVAEATGAVDGLLRSPTVRVLMPGDRHWELLREAIVDGGARGNLVHDAQIVAVCREHGVSELLTEDQDFRRFPEITVRRLS